MNVKAIAQSGSMVFLVDIGRKGSIHPDPRAPKLLFGVVVDLRERGIRANPFPIDNILARGYLEKPTADKKTLEKVIKLVKSSRKGDKKILE